MSDAARYARLALEGRALLRAVLNEEVHPAIARAWVENDEQFAGAHLAVLANVGKDP